MAITDTVKSLVSSFGGKKSPSVLGIDISSSSIKVVQLRLKGGRAVLETYGEIALGPYAGQPIGQATNLPADKIADALRDVLRESKVTTLNAGVALPLSSSFISVIEVPNVEEKQLQSLVPIEARKYIPVPVNEVMLDWQIIPADLEYKGSKHDRREVLMVAIHKETIAKHNDIVRKSGVTASFFEIEVFSTVRAVLERGIRPIVIIDVGVSSTKLYIVEHGIIRDTHTITLGSQDITRALAAAQSVSIGEAEDIKRLYGISKENESSGVLTSAEPILNRIASEVERVILAYSKKYDKPVAEGVITGGGSLLKGFHEWAITRFNIDIKRADPFRKVETPAFLGDILKEAGPEFAVALGVALRKLEEVS